MLVGLPERLEFDAGPELERIDWRHHRFPLTNPDPVAEGQCVMFWVVLVAPDLRVPLVPVLMEWAQ